MRLKQGSSVQLALTDGTTVEGVVRFSWRFRVIKLTDVVALNERGEVVITGYLLIPARSVLFAKVGD